MLWMLSELRDLDPADERFDAKMTVLIENVRHHPRESPGTWTRLWRLTNSNDRRRTSYRLPPPASR